MRTSVCDSYFSWMAATRPRSLSTEVQIQMSEGVRLSAQLDFTPRDRRGFVGHELKWRPTATLPPMAMLPPTATPEVECFDWSSYQTHMAHTESLICQRPMCSFMQAISLGCLEERTLRIVSASCPSHMNLMHPTPTHTHFRIPPLLSQSSSQRMAWHTQLRPSSRCHGQS